MLKITVQPFEMFDSATSEFIQCAGGELSLEHSLISISKWEAKWHKPYIDPNPTNRKTVEEFLDYVRQHDWDKNNILVFSLGLVQLYIDFA